MALLFYRTQERYDHALATAKLFRQEWVDLGEAMDFAKYKDWQRKKLYLPRTPKADFKIPRRKQGESLSDYELRVRKDNNDS